VPTLGPRVRFESFAVKTSELKCEVVRGGARAGRGGRLVVDVRFRGGRPVPVLPHREQLGVAFRERLFCAVARVAGLFVCGVRGAV